jgi:hypothetical protein
MYTHVYTLLQVLLAIEALMNLIGLVPEAPAVVARLFSFFFLFLFSFF